MEEQRWVEHEGDPAGIAALARVTRRLRVGYDELLARLLWNRGVRDVEAAGAFLRPTLARGLRSPVSMRGMADAVTRLADALGAKEPIAVCAGRDADGIAGAAQLMLFLRELDAEPLLCVSPREWARDDGAAVRGVAAAGARVIVTAGCGMDGPGLALAADLGLAAIVCARGGNARAIGSQALAVLDPCDPDCPFPFKGLSGAGLVFYLLLGLRMELRARGWRWLPDLRGYLDLVALGTVADRTPLREENRVLVTRGLERLERTAWPGLVALKEGALVEHATVQAVDTGLVRRLSNLGLLGDVHQAVDLLTTNEPERARILAAELEVRNAEWRALEDVAVAEAVAMAGEGGDRSGLVLAHERWHPRVVGRVAARVLERCGRPVLAIAAVDDGGYGAGCAPDGFDLHGAIGECADLLDRCGGPAQAVDLTVRRGSLPALITRFDAAVRRRSNGRPGIPPLEIDAEVSLALLTPGLATALALLEPHGPGNPEPALLVRGAEVVGVRTGGDPERPHLKLRVKQEGRTVTAMGPGLGRFPVEIGDHVDVVCRPRLARWQGRERLEVVLAGARILGAPDRQYLVETTEDYAIP